jgi:hypothetical protein
MSLTHSRGLTAAGRWTAVAATLADHLDALESANGANVAPPPLGAIEAARRFFNFVLTGIDLDLKRSSVSNIASAPGQTTAAGISNLSIAVKVIRSEKPNATPNDLEQVEREIRSLLNSLNQLDARNKPLPATERKALATFLRELQRQGEIERDAAVAAQERPIAYRSLVR